MAHHPERSKAAFWRRAPGGVFPGARAVGRESKAHPAFCIIPSPDAERHHLPPTQGYKWRIGRNGEGLNRAEGGMRFAFPPYGDGIKKRDSEFTK
jgi:hypothetical protein